MASGGVKSLIIEGLLKVVGGNDPEIPEILRLDLDKEREGIFDPGVIVDSPAYKDYRVRATGLTSPEQLRFLERWIFTNRSRMASAIDGYSELVEEHLLAVGAWVSAVGRYDRVTAARALINALEDCKYRSWGFASLLFRAPAILGNADPELNISAILHGQEIFRRLGDFEYGESGHGLLTSQYRLFDYWAMQRYTTWRLKQGGLDKMSEADANFALAFSWLRLGHLSTSSKICLQGEGNETYPEVYRAVLFPGIRAGVLWSQGSIDDARSLYERTYGHCQLLYPSWADSSLIFWAEMESRAGRGADTARAILESGRQGIQGVRSYVVDELLKTRCRADDFVDMRLRLKREDYYFWDYSRYQ